MKARSFAAALLAAGVAGLPVVTPAAQQTMQGEGGMMGMHGPAMQAAMERMRRGIEMPSSGDPDMDFARMMIPHHQSAIEMAKPELQNGKDPEMRQLADEVIEAQGKEIELLQGWLRNKGG